MTASQTGHANSSYLALEVFTHDLRLEDGSRLSTAAGRHLDPRLMQAAVAFHFLDYPLLLTYAQSSRTSGITSQHQALPANSISFQNGKSCVLEEQPVRLEQLLEQNPLHVSLLDTQALPRPQLIASGSTILRVSAPGPLPQHALGSGLPHAAVRSISLYSPEGNMVCTARVSCRLTNYGPNPPPLALPPNQVTSTRTLQHTPSPGNGAELLHQTWPPAATARPAWQGYTQPVKVQLHQEATAQEPVNRETQHSPAEAMHAHDNGAHGMQKSALPALYYQNIPRPDSAEPQLHSAGQAAAHSAQGVPHANVHPKAMQRNTHTRQAWAARQYPQEMKVQAQLPQDAWVQQQQQQQQQPGTIQPSAAYDQWDTHSQASRDEFAQAEAAAHASWLAVTNYESRSFDAQNMASMTQAQVQQAHAANPAAGKGGPSKARGKPGTAGQKSVPALRSLLRSSQAQTHKLNQGAKVLRTAVPPLSLGKALPVQRQKAGDKGGDSLTRSRVRPAVQQPQQHQQVWNAAAADSHLHAVYVPAHKQQELHMNTRLPNKVAGHMALLQQQGSTGGDEGSWGIKAAWPEHFNSNNRPTHMQASATQTHRQNTAPASHPISPRQSLPYTANHSIPVSGPRGGAGASAGLYPPGSMMHSCMEGGMVGRTMYSQGLPQGPHPSEGMFHTSSVLMWEMMNLVCMRTALSAAVGSLQNSVSGMATQLVNNACAPAFSLAQQQQVAAAVVAAMQAQAAGGAMPVAAAATGATAFMQQQAAMNSMLSSQQHSIPLPPLNVHWQDSTVHAAGPDSGVPLSTQPTSSVTAGVPLSTQPTTSVTAAAVNAAPNSPLRLTGAVSEPAPAAAVRTKPPLGSKSAAVTRRPSRSQSAQCDKAQPAVGQRRSHSRDSSSVRTEAVPSDSYSADFNAEETNVKSPSVKEGGWVQPQERTNSAKQSKQAPDSVHTSSVQSYEEDFEDVQASRPQAATTSQGRAQQVSGSRPASSPSLQQDISEEDLAGSQPATQAPAKAAQAKVATRTRRYSSADTAALLYSSEDGSSKHSAELPATLIKPTSTAQPSPAPTSRPSPAPTTRPSPAPSHPATTKSGYSKSIKSVRSTRSRHTEAGSSISSSGSVSSHDSSATGSVISSDGGLPLTPASRKHVGFIPGVGNHGSKSGNDSSVRSSHKPASSRRSRAASEANTDISFLSSSYAGSNNSSGDGSGGGSSSGDGHTRSEELDVVKSLKAPFKQGRMGNKRHSHASRSSKRRSSSYTVGTSSFNSSEISFTASEGSSDDEDDVSIEITGDHESSGNRNLQQRQSLQKRLSQTPTARRLTHTNRQDSTKSFMMSEITDIDMYSSDFDSDEIATALDDPKDAVSKHRQQHATNRTNTGGQVWTNPAHTGDSSYLGETGDIMEEISNLSSHY